MSLQNAFENLAVEEKQDIQITNQEIIISDLDIIKNIDYATSEKQDTIAQAIENIPQTDVSLLSKDTTTQTTNDKLTELLGKDFSTSTKQLPDNHQVTVSNIADVPLVDVSLLAVESKQDDIITAIENIPQTDVSLLSTEETSLLIKENQTNGTQVSKIKQTIPTDALNLNPTSAITYDGNGNVATVTKTIGGINYRKTLTYTGTQLTSISAWVVV